MHSFIPSSFISVANTGYLSDFLPCFHRKFLQIIDVPVAKSFLTRKCLEFDEEWAAIQRKTHFYFPFGNCRRVMPHARLVISPEVSPFQIKCLLNYFWKFLIYILSSCCNIYFYIHHVILIYHSRRSKKLECS